MVNYRKKLYLFVNITDNLLMKSFWNFIFLFITVLVFSPAHAYTMDCSTEVVNEHCHSAENNTKEKKSDKSKETQNDCSMACCHMTLTKANELLRNLIMASTSFTYPQYKISNIVQYQNELFRPPIA